MDRIAGAQSWDLPSRLASAPWIVFSNNHSDSAGEASVWKTVRRIADSLGPRVAGRAGQTEEEIEPSDKFHAHPRSASAQVGLRSIPFHVELSHRAIPCRYVILGCLSAGRKATATRLVARHDLKFDAEEKALLRSAPLIVRSGRASFYATILPRAEDYLRYDPNCMEAVDERGKAALQVVERRLAESTEYLLEWHEGQILVIDNWSALHGRSEAEAGSGRRLARIMIDA